MKVAVLGTGRVGSLIALDLATKHEVTAFDSSTVNLQRLERTNSSIRTVMCELRNTKRYPEMLEGFDLVVSAVPGWFGYYTLKAIIEAGKNVVDISFSPEDPFHLNELALEKNVTAVVDCGVAPGLSHMIAGMDDTQFELEKFTCYVGGLPKIRTKPFEYKAPFSPMDVIEEYTRPARLMEDGRVSTRAAFSDLEHIQAGKIGTLEAFNTDGLRTLLRTMKHVPNMVEKTLRYPGHANLMTTLFDTGLLEGNLDVLFDK